MDTINNVAFVVTARIFIVAVDIVTASIELSVAPCAYISTQTSTLSTKTPTKTPTQRMDKS